MIILFFVRVFFQRLVSGTKYFFENIAPKDRRGKENSSHNLFSSSTSSAVFIFWQ
jgi:hypothetical protein